MFLILSPYDILFNFIEEANINCITKIILNGKIQALYKNIKTKLPVAKFRWINQFVIPAIEKEWITWFLLVPVLHIACTNLHITSCVDTGLCWCKERCVWSVWCLLSVQQPVWTRRCSFWPLIWYNFMNLPPNIGLLPHVSQNYACIRY